MAASQASLLSLEPCSRRSSSSSIALHHRIKATAPPSFRISLAHASKRSHHSLFLTHLETKPGTSSIRVVTDSETAPLIIESAVPDPPEEDLDLGGGGGGGGGDEGFSGGDGGGGDNNNNNNNSGGDQAEEGNPEKKMSMSQKLTLGYAALVGGLSAALLVVMGSRFKKSGKIFPAGVVSLVSLIMTGGYFHGILRGMHA